MDKPWNLNFEFIFKYWQQIKIIKFYLLERTVQTLSFHTLVLR